MALVHSRFNLQSETKTTEAASTENFPGGFCPGNQMFFSRNKSIDSSQIRKQKAKGVPQEQHKLPSFTPRAVGHFPRDDKEQTRWTQPFLVSIISSGQREEDQSISGFWSSRSPTAHQGTFIPKEFFIACYTIYLFCFKIYVYLFE